MGYYAYYEGYMEMKEECTELPASIVADIEYIFPEYTITNGTIEMYGDGKYYEEETVKLLKDISPYLEMGTVAFYGEDHTHWRFLYIDGRLVEQQGDIVWETNREL